MKTKVTVEEYDWLAIMRLNKAIPREEIIKSWTVRQLKIKFLWRSKDNLWGRFGGGWNWKLGFQAGGRTVIISLLVCEIQFDVNREGVK